MDERSAIAVMSGERRDTRAKLLRGACRIASWGYSAAVQLRNVAYDRGWFRIEQVPVPVISVGNITSGGTGKTPIVAWLVNELTRRGYRPGILSRGYRSLDGHTNDEALVLERLCPGTPHVQNRDRVAGAEIAVARHGCNVLVLDDGYQHRRLHRDLDILLVDALRPWGFGHVLPRGLLREPLTNLWRADLVLVTRADSLTTILNITRELRRHRGTDLAALVRFAPANWISGTGSILDIHSLPARHVAAFCGIGNPAGFFPAVASYAEVIDTRVFSDHHHYTSGDLDELERWRKSLGIEVLATTLKDLVKIPAEHAVAEHTLALDIRCEFASGLERVLAALDCVCPDRKALRQAA